MNTLTFDVMLRGRWVCTLRYPYSPLWPVTEQELTKFTEAKRPSLKGKPYRIAFCHTSRTPPRNH